MVREELYIHACRYAIGELARKGSTGFITSSDEGGQLITWVEVMEWLNREQQSEDAISRADAIKALDYDIKSFEFKSGVCKHMNEIANLLNTIYEIQSDNIKALPPVQPKTGHCKDCKYFEYDHFENMGGIPLITAHKVCKRHGLICKTNEDGYCHLWEHKAESEE